MAYLILPHKRTRQPQHPVELSNSPLVRGLQIAVIPHISRMNLANRRYLLTGSSTATRHGVNGVYGLYRNFLSFTAINFSVANGYSIAIGLFATSLPFTGGIFGTRCATVYGPCLYLSHGSITDLNSGFGRGTTTGETLGRPTGGQIALNTEYFLAVSHRADTTSRLYHGTIASTGTSRALPTDNITEASLGAVRGTAVDTAPNAYTSIALMWDRALSDDEHIELAVNPWQLFRPIERRIYVGPSAGGGDVTGTSTASFALGAASAGMVALAGASTASFALGATSAAQVAVDGASSHTAQLGAQSAGSVESGAVTGTSTASFALGAASAGAVEVAGASAHSFALGAASAGAVAVDGASTAGFVLGAASAGTVAELRYGRPVADVDAGAWSPSTGADLYAMLDEPVADDDDDIFASAETVAVLKCRDLDLSAMTTPALRVRVPGGFTAAGRLVVALYQGNSPGTLVAAVDETDPAAGLYEHTLSAGEAALITDGADLYFRVQAAAG